MSDKKMKVKDLASELGLPSKDILSAAKELGVAGAKAAGSNLTEAETVKLREHIAGPTEPAKPEVIIRRRRPATEATEEVTSVGGAEKPAENLAEATEKTPVVAEKTEKEATPEPEGKEAKVEKPAPHKQPTSKKEPVPASVAKIIKPATPPVAEKAKIIESEKAKIIEPEKAKIIEPEKAVAPKVTAKTTSEVETPLISKEPVAPEANISGDDDKARPAVFSAEPEKDARGATISSAPALAPERDGDANGEAGVSSVRVISRPTTPAEKKVATPRAGERPAGRPGERPAGRPGERPAGRPGERQDKTFAPRTPRPAQTQGAPREEGRQVPPGLNVPMPESEQGRKKRSKGRRTVEFGARSNEREDFNMTRSTGRRKSRNRKEQPLTSTQPMKAGKRVIKVEEFIRLSDLAHQMGLKSGEIIKSLFALGVMATINQSLDIDTATLIANEFEYEVEKIGVFEEDALAQHRVEDVAGEMEPRPPVVTIMGHVDHGKTSLLDALRKATVASGEAGGITQHIGAYHVKTPKGEIVFLDTPGHEAFTAMRARGAEVTDIVVLVVAADDGVMEQTREAISHAKAAKVPIMVAVNKMDKEEADPDRVKRELADQGLVAEDWGGDVTFSYVSAKTRQGLDELLELLALQAEILELKANPSKEAMGHIVEAKLDKGRGALGTVLITSGTLRQGDVFVCGIHAGRVRAMFNDQGKKVKEAGPSMPVEVQGFEGVPMAGDEFFCLADEKKARRIAETRALKQRERELAKESKITLETFLASRVDDVEAVVLNLVVKADVQGSLEAIIDALLKLSNEKVRINVMHGGAGAISESDVLLATASNAIIIGFNVRPTAKAKELAENEKVDMRFYEVIYKLVEEITNAMEGMLAPIEKEVYLGVADVRETFSVPKIGLVAGCHVSDGKITRAALARLLRDGVVIYTGKIDSLRRFKDDVREVAKGYECGIGLENYNDVKTGDVIEAYEIVEEAAKL